jgi:hypothetical protein
MTWGDRITECDCCGARVSRERIGRVIAYGIETFACDVCRGEAPVERDESDRLVHRKEMDDGHQ